MKTTNFNISRLQHFMYRQAVMNMKTLLTSSLSWLGTLLVLTVLFSYFSSHQLSQITLIHTISFFITGFLITSKVFSELHDPLKGYFYLTLPVSNLERLAGSWLLTSPLFIIGFGLFTFLMLLLASIISGIPLTAAVFTDVPYLKYISVYLVVQTVFFLGACYFRKNNFSKTLSSVLFILVSISVFTFIMAYIFFNNHGLEVTDFHYNSNSLSYTIMKKYNIYSIEKNLRLIVTTFFWYFLGPFMLLVTYFRLKERQL